jgi:hypothetical protein
VVPSKASASQVVVLKESAIIPAMSHLTSGAPFSGPQTQFLSPSTTSSDVRHVSVVGNMDVEDGIDPIT